MISSQGSSTHKHSVTIYGAKTLERFTVGILANGFTAIGWHAEAATSLTKLPIAPVILVQLHGAPHAREDDTLLLHLLASIFKTPPQGLRLAVLVHRPDELPLIHPNFRTHFDAAAHATPPVPFHLVFMGDTHINDACYAMGPHVSRHVIPHCFFPLTSHFPPGIVSVGSFTTWGEMRSVRGVLKLLLALFKRKQAQSPPIVGYLGGRPAADIAPSTLKELCAAIDPSIVVTVLEAKSVKSAGDLPVGSHAVILVDLEGSESITPTFNTQMYHLGSAVRTGESSGSVHASAGIPVILEMNGSEAIEKLQVIKVPYASRESMDSVDYAAGASAILKTVADGSYEAMLRHNAEQARHFTNAYSASAYATLFTP